MKKLILAVPRDAEQKEHEHLKTELRNIHEKWAEGAIFRSEVRWIQEGE